MLSNICSSIHQHVRSAVSQECYQTWFKDLTVLSVDGVILRMAAPNRYVKLWLESHYKKELYRAVVAQIPEINEVDLTVVATPRATDSTVSMAKVMDNALPQNAGAHGNSNGHSNIRNSPDRRDTVRLLPLSPKHRLESFLVGKSNRIAHSAAQCVAESPGTVYNPLFIHGAHGLGKTHLMHGIGHLMMEQNPPLVVTHISCEEFTNAYVAAVQSKRLDVFRARFRSCDVLLIDDVQFLGGRERTQEEFLYTFDALRNSHKQVVLCSDTAPRDIKKLDPKLVTRFQSGLVARLDTPDHPLRVELLRDKARARGLVLANDVAEVLAAHIDSNVRELEGAVCKLMALSVAEAHANGNGKSHKSDGHAPDRELAIQTLRELGYLRSGPLTLQDILAAVGQRYSVSADELRSGKRHSSLVHARHIGMYLSKTLTSHSVADIGRFYGNRDHATVLHAARKVAEMIKRDDIARDEVQSMRQLLGR